MSTDQTSHLQAVVGVAEQGGRYVWVITLVDFAAARIKRNFVSEETFATADAARDAGESRLAALAADK